MEEEKIMAALQCKARYPEKLNCPDCPYAFQVGNSHRCDTRMLFGDVLRMLEEIWEQKEKEDGRK